jgi:hypothetical protein
VKDDLPKPNGEDNRETRTGAGAARLLQILLTESAHLIWVLRCERVIQEKPILRAKSRQDGLIT